MAAIGQQCGPSNGTPDTYCSIAAGRGNVPTVWRPGHGVHNVDMPTISENGSAYGMVGKRSGRASCESCHKAGTTRYDDDECQDQQTAGDCVAGEPPPGMDFLIGHDWEPFLGIQEMTGYTVYKYYNSTYNTWLDRCRSCAASITKALI